MKNSVLVNIIGLAAVVSAFPVTMAHAADRRNAATLYERAIAELEQLDISSEDWDVVAGTWQDDPDAPVPDAARAALARARPALRLMQRASAQAYSDFGLNYDDGFQMQLSHLTPMRQLSRLIASQATLHLRDGNATAAAQSIATLVNVGDHVAQDRTMISSMVGTAIYGLSDSTLQHALDEGALTPAGAARILRTMDEIGANDPFGYADAMAIERDLALETMRHMFDDPQQVNAILSLGDAHLPERLSAMAEEDFDLEVQRYDAAMDRATELFHETDPEKARTLMAELEKQIESGEHGYLASLLMPAFGKALEWKLKTEATMQERRTLLRDLARGEVDALAQANAAIWYVRAGEALGQRELDILRAMHDAAGDPQQPAPEPVRELLAGADDVRHLIAEASKMKRCDFAHLNEWKWEPIVIPSYATRLRDVLNMLLVDAAEARRSGDSDAFARRLETLLIVIDHLTGDPMYLTAIMTHDALNQAAALVGDQLSDEQKTRLHSIINRYSRSDTFGYIAATARARKGLVESIAVRMTLETAEQIQQFELMTKRAGDWQADELLALGVILREAEPAQPSDVSAQQWRGQLAEFSDVFSPEAVEAARTRAPGVLTAMRAGDPAAMNLDLPIVAGLSERIGRARRDLRDALGVLAVVEAGEKLPAAAPESGNTGP